MDLYNSELYFRDFDEAIDRTECMKHLYGKTVLITGATGSIGSYITDLLIRTNEKDNAGIRIIATGRNLEKLQKRFKHREICLARFDLKGDINLPDENVDYIIHAAGNAHAGTFNRDPVGTIVGNIAGTARLLDYAKDHGTDRFVFISSGEVYGKGDLSLPSFEESYSGKIDSMSPRACYPNSKRAVETLCASYYKQFRLKTVVARLSHTYGPTMNEGDIRAHAMFLNNAIRGENIIMNSPGKQVRSYSYIEDSVTGALTVLIYGEPGEAYNVANPDSVASIAEFAREAARYSTGEVIFKVPTENDLANRTPIEKQVLNSDKLMKLGWEGRYTLQEGIRHSIQIMKEAGAL